MGLGLHRHRVRDVSRLPDRLGRTVGKYKGMLFRSLYEYSYYKSLERQGIDICSDVVYEPLEISYRVPGKTRTYHPDFLVRSTGLLVEVKCSRELSRNKGSRIRHAKFVAAEKYCEDNGLRFVILTERDFPLIAKVYALRDPDVSWIKPPRSYRKKRRK